jgi:hypothetical protein
MDQRSSETNPRTVRFRRPETFRPGWNGQAVLRSPQGPPIRLSEGVIQAMTSLRDQLGAASAATSSETETRGDLPEDRRHQRRSPTDTDVVVVTPDGEFAGTTANLSYTGVLALLPRPTVPVGTAVNVNLSNPLVELELDVGGKVIHSRPCDGGVTAHGIQLQYPVERIDEVMAFIEFLQKFARARRHEVVSGPIDEAGLAPVLDLFVNTAPAGTLDVHRGDEMGRIVFSENYLLRCVLGLVSGQKALARMFRWTEGRFEFHHDLQLAGAEPDPQPIEAAAMMASVQVDEMNRISPGSLRGSATFVAGTSAASVDADGLTDLEREVLEYARDGFSIEAVADMIDAPDADVWKAFHTLVDCGSLSPGR